jgi:RNA polymerase sigma-70 factor (ECF subfamily)
LIAADGTFSRERRSDGKVGDFDGQRDVQISLAREALAYADTLFNLARYLTGSHADGEDLVQETYARALAHSESFRGGNLKAWLFRILRNTFIDLYRRQRNNPTRGGFDTVSPTVEPLSLGELLRDDIELDHLRGMVAADIEAALMTLTDDGRAVVLLDLEGLTEVEVADVLGCPVGTVKSRLARARAALRSRLRQYARSDEQEE